MRRGTRVAFNIVERVIYNGAVSRSLWQGANYDGVPLHPSLPLSRDFLRLVRSPSFWARKSDISGADKLRSDWKVSATWVESRLGEILICPVRGSKRKGVERAESKKEQERERREERDRVIKNEG